MKKIFLAITALVPGLFLFGTEANPRNENRPPLNLLVNASVNGDNNGRVVFTATARNAGTYYFDFGNGKSLSSFTGIVEYKYPAAGIYQVHVIAKNKDRQTTSKSIQVEIKAKYVLVWSDEFDKDGPPDPARWKYDLGAGGWGNAELQNYTNRSENAIVQGGVLKVKAIKENFGGSDYTSARLVSAGKFDFTYGKVEVRAKLPAGVGTWPAIWMLGSNVSTTHWPACGEIDIVEHRGYELNKIFGTLHYPGRSGGNADGSTKMIPNTTTEFHLYKLEWTADFIKIFADDVLIHSIANSKNIPFNHDFFFIINLAMGGGFGGAIDPSFTNATLEVDYIRVYR